MFERLFKLSEHGTTVRTEVIAGLTTFLTMSYIIFVNPDILSTTGMDRDAVFVATCLAAALGSMVMATVANWPIGMARLPAGAVALIRGCCTTSFGTF